jgi:hypothetical protein
MVVAVGTTPGVGEGLDGDATEATPQPVIENTVTIKINLIVKNLLFMGQTPFITCLMDKTNLLPTNTLDNVFRV